MSDLYQTVTDKIISALESGCAPWLKPWKSSNSGESNQPHNASTGRPYNGVNWLILSCSDYNSAGWLTYKQAQALGGNVKKGEKGTSIVFWQFNIVKDKATGDEKTVPFMRAYTVFNVEQCEGLEGKVKLPTPPIVGDTCINDLAAKHGAIVRHGGNKASFSIAGDFIRMPSLSAFSALSGYQATLAHELTHWTGHSSRLDRKFGTRFGNDDYAFEELVAELGSAFICAAHGIDLTELQHTSYLASWLRILKADNKAIFTASSKAKQAAEYLLGESEREELIAA